MNLVRAASEQASDVRLGEEVPHVLGKKQHAGVAKQKPVARSFRHFDVYQHVFDRMPRRNVGEPQPRVELVSIEVLRVVEARTGREVEPDHALGAEEVAYLAPAELLRLRPLPPEEAFAALHRLLIALPHLHGEHLAHPIGEHLHWRVAVAGDVLNPRPQRIGVLDALHNPVVAHAEQNPAARRIRQGDQRSGERRRQALLELQRGALALLDKDFEISCRRRCHA